MKELNEQFDYQFISWTSLHEEFARSLDQSTASQKWQARKVFGR